MTNMKAAERAAELANAVPGNSGGWEAKHFLASHAPNDMRAFVQFIADADAAARKADEAIAYYSISNPARQVLKPFILPDDVDPLVEMKGVGDFLTDQRDEPLFKSDSARLHYWRDKAITAAKRLEAIRIELEQGK